MPKLSRIFAMVLVAGFAAGCATTTTTWKKPNVNKAQLEKDLQMCSQRAGLMFSKTGYQGGPVASSSKTSYESHMGEPFEKCMARIGYNKDK